MLTTDIPVLRRGEGAAAAIDTNREFTMLLRTGWSLLLVCLSVVCLTVNLRAQEESGAVDGAGLDDFEPIDYEANGDIGLRFADGQNDLSMLGTLGLTTLDPNYLSGSFGVAFIDDETFLMLRLQPELTFGKFGVGLDIPIVYGLDDGSLRTNEYEDGAGILRFIRYLRYGHKRVDPLYIRVGDLNAVSLGAGFIMYRYNNSASFEQRAIGVSFDVHSEDGYGVEGVFGDFSDPAVMGLRPYVRPLTLLDSEIPILKNIELGLPIVQDNGDFATPAGSSITAWGVDGALPIGLTSLLTLTPYVAWSTLSISDRDSILDAYVFADDGSEEFKPGSGTALGVNMVLQVPGSFLTLSAKLERRWFGPYFSGSYFDPVYSANKYSGIHSIQESGDTINIGTHPTRKLLSSDDNLGWFGALYGNVFGKLLVGGSLQIPDVKRTIEIPGTTATVTNGATLHIEARGDNLLPDFLIGARYDRNYIQDVGDAFKLDERSVINAVVARKLGDYLRLGLHYRWTFAEVDGKTEATSYVFPYISITIGLGGGGEAKPEQNDDGDDN